MSLINSRIYIAPLIPAVRCSPAQRPLLVAFTFTLLAQLRSPSASLALLSRRYLSPFPCSAGGSVNFHVYFVEYLLTQIHLTLLPWEAQEVQAKAWINYKQLLNKFRSFMVLKTNPYSDGL
jgi:hypothetical protein